MKVIVRTSGETERYWKQDAYGIHMSSLPECLQIDGPCVAIRYKRASKGGGVVDHRIEVTPKMFAALMEAMLATDRAATIAAYRAGTISIYTCITNG